MTTELPTLASFAGYSIAPPFRSIGAFVRAHAELYEDRLAIDCFEDSERLSYRELETLSDQVGHGLAARGVGKGDRVVTLLPNRIEYPVTWIALSKLGALMVPVPTSYTAVELSFILRDADASFLIIDQAFVPLLAEIGQLADMLPNESIIVRNSTEPTLYADWRSLVVDAPRPLSLDAIGPDDLAGLQYTSGTTGAPKGCMVTHDYWMLLGRALSASIHSDILRILSPNPFNYMNGRNLLMTAMERGATLFLARRPSTSRFLGWIADHGIDYCFFPQLVLKQKERPEDLRTPLKEVAVSAISPEAHREFERRFGVRSYELYGMTEIGAALAGDSRARDAVGSGRLGRPMLGRAVSVRDEQGQAVSPGGEGELWVTGPSMTTGYFGRPEADKEVFHDGWFRTGDLVRLGTDGELYFVGRIKDIVRRSNENISAKEIEDSARLIEIVEDAAVVAVPCEERGEEVKIFLQLKPGVPAGKDSIEKIERYFQSSLAPFKRPRFYAFVADLPRTPSLKVKKAALREPPFSDIEQFDITLVRRQ